MKNLLVIPALLMLAACGISEDKFAEDYVDNYCDAWTECESEGDCPLSTSDDADDGDDAVECDFDPKAAKDCLKADWSCDDDGYPSEPAACDFTKIFDCPEPAEEE